VKGLAVTTSSVLLGGNSGNNILAILSHPPLVWFPFSWVLCRAACAGPVHCRSPVRTPPPLVYKMPHFPKLGNIPTVDDLFRIRDITGSSSGFRDRLSWHVSLSLRQSLEVKA